MSRIFFPEEDKTPWFSMQHSLSPSTRSYWISIPLFLLIFKIRETSNVLVRVTIGIGDDIHNSNAAALEVSLAFISFFITFFFSSTLFQIILYPHFFLLRLRKALHKSLPAGAEASVPMPETRNKRTRIRLILTAHTTICARNILFLHDLNIL